MKIIKIYKKWIVPSLLLVFINTGCKENTAYKEILNNPQLFHNSMKKLTDVIVYDIFSPPVASRVYMYPSVAAYTVVQKGNTELFNPIEQQINELKAIPDPTDENVNFNLAALHAFTEVGKDLIFSEDKMTAYQNNMYDSLTKAGLPNKVLVASKEYGEIVKNHILEWADKDMYKQTRTYPKYTILEEDKFWKPTPPDYMDGIEPHWNVMRTLVLDSAGQFPPKPPLAFDLTDDSEFKKQLLEVFEKGSGRNEEEKAIASFWDCNPYVSHHRGHAMFATKKITPGGHWIGITKIAATKSNSDFAETVNAYTNVSIALYDAFISCWDEKWRSLVVRPETLINQHIDEEWVPLLQTPPFPEYTSGHSVISRAAAITLTDLYGDNFEFLDTTELEYGLPARSFKSFIQASEEAAISRLYGGIHYMMAIEEGVNQGQKVGEFIVDNLQTKKEAPKVTAIE
ncbi:vanadium-dependent haloperoxidase [Spongiivirga sp. MCCC 1A20706]|uniref:vanadium-dependent haloperoxidase n=1 Tax=Spongiivirga sp. MCCC 1A20706 TaxID=3160963 RepID=UPI003977DF79